MSYKPGEKVVEPDLNLSKKPVSYKEKLLNIFGEDVSKKVTDTFCNLGNQNQSLQDQNYGAGRVIPLSDEELNLWSKPWQKTLVVKLMGKKVNFKILEASLQRKWPKKGSIKLVDMADGYFLVHFVAEEDYSFALCEGPWMVADHYLIV